MTLLEEINRRGTTIVMVTHAKDIVDRMKKRVVTINQGRIVRDDVGAYALRRRKPAATDNVKACCKVREVKPMNKFMYSLKQALKQMEETKA